MKICNEKDNNVFESKIGGSLDYYPKAADGNATKSNIYKHDSNLLF